MEKELEKAREELINLYLNIKIRTQEEVIIIINYFLQLTKIIGRISNRR